ncbi:hypothetical protein [Spiroplasma endosymbiont of Labia minor]|uniref:hypothetical protein n=1 Tax=Spiroplasma endosymbiont of Labia minor TaxID=3066305 RepID=UPI0030D00D1B
MHVKKIIVKNFLDPDVQRFEFTNKGILKKGSFYSQDEIKILENLLNGSWQAHTMSFEKYYPKFEKRISDMNLEIDALVKLTDEEIILINRHLEKIEKPLIKANVWYYQIKCFWPYIFPVVRLKPAIKDYKDKPIALGTHYDMFYKPNATKAELLTVTGISAVGKFRETYYNYKKLKIDRNARILHVEYLKIIKSIFRNSEAFMQKIANVIDKIPDDDILNYGDQKDFFFRNDSIEKWVNSFELFSSNYDIKLDFLELLWDYYFRDLQYIYKIRTSTEAVDILQHLAKYGCANAVDYRSFQKILHTTIKRSEDDLREKTKRMNRLLHDPSVDKIYSKYEEMLQKQADLIDKQEAAIKKIKPVSVIPIKQRKRTLKLEKENQKKSKKETIRRNKEADKNFKISQNRLLEDKTENTSDYF